MRYSLAALLAAGLSFYATETISADPWITLEPGGSTLCSNGEKYRFHVRKADPTRLLLFFNGGGACWNASTCDPLGKPTYRVNAESGSGNDPREYDGAFALDNPENPFADWSQVFVSYCSGDVHLGNRRASYTREDGSMFVVQHRGRVNSEAALAYVYREFPRPDTIVVAGGSAGALASPIYAAEVASHYPDSRLVQFAGGGTGYRLPPPTDLWEQWGVIPALPEVIDRDGLSPATLQINDLYRLGAEAAPEVSFHSYDTAYDAVQEQFMQLLGSPTELLEGLDANLQELQRQIPTMRSYVGGGEFHTLLRYSDLYSRSTNGVRAVDWLRAVINGDAVENVHCAGDACRAP
jgi:hypothetical protein